MAHVSGLYIYPVKSLRGYAVQSAEVDALGFVGDRRFMVVDDTGKFMTQRAFPHMARVETKLESETLTLSTEGMSPISVGAAPDPSAEIRQVSVWKSEGLEAEDCGNEVGEWLSSHLSHRCRLVRIGPRFSRPVLKRAAQPGDKVTFADAVPFLLVNEDSLIDLNNRIRAQHGEPVQLDRFRPNIIVSGCAAFVEDSWTRFRIGSLDFLNAGPCARCAITATDQLTGARGKEPLRTLATFRKDTRDPQDVNFGINLVCMHKVGSLSLSAKLQSQEVISPIHLNSG